VAIQHGSGKTLIPWNEFTTNLILRPGVLWLTLIIIIQIAGGAAAPDSDAFPSSCPEDAQNCYRIANEPYATNQTEVWFNASAYDLREAAGEWVDDQSLAIVTFDDDIEFHAVFRTKFLLFPDDLFLRTGCTDQGAYIQIHSESRLGVSDLGVNEERVEELISYLQNQQFEPMDECVQTPVV